MSSNNKVDGKRPDNPIPRSIFVLIVFIGFTFLVLCLYFIAYDFGIAIIFFVMFILTIAFPSMLWDDEPLGQMLGMEEPEEGWEQSGKEAKENLRDMLNRPTESGAVSDIEHPELRTQVEDKQTEGWEIDEIDNSAEKVVMIGTKGGTVGGHALTAVLTGFTTFGAGNVVYDRLSKKNNRERIVLRVDEDNDNAPEDSDTDLDGIELLKELKGLNEEGIISDEEFEKKKEEILKEI
jgi:hypothetical protein